MNRLQAAKLIETRWKAGGNIFVTSDIHGFHKNLARGSSSWGDGKSPEERDKALAGCRPYVNEVVMTNEITAGINADVGEDDLLIHLGDFAFGGAKNIPITRNKIKCKNIITLFGNHDEHLLEDENLQGLFTACLDYLEFRVNGKDVICQHYPIEEWNNINRGSFHFFGHRHTQEFVFKHNRSADVGLDGNNFRVHKLETLIDLFSAQPIERKHH